ncbi:hypothetical protein GCM10009551_013680 [Nocardiopsis tropica]
MRATVWNGVRERVEALARQDRASDVFGARDGHGVTGDRFRLAAPLTEREVSSAETLWGVSLPADYRSFLIKVGAGGAGPGYGLGALHRTDTGWEWADPSGDMRHASLGSVFPTAEERSRLLAEHEHWFNHCRLRCENDLNQVQHLADGTRRGNHDVPRCPLRSHVVLDLEIRLRKTQDTPRALKNPTRGRPRPSAVHRIGHERWARTSLGPTMGR